MRNSKKYPSKIFIECLFEQFIMISYSYIRQECTFFYWYFYVQLVHGMPFSIKKAFFGSENVGFS